MNTITTAVLVAAASSACLAQSDIPDLNTFLVPFAEVGTELFFGNGIIPNSNDFDGAVITEARIELVLDVFDTEPGDERNSSAANFLAEVIIPVDIDPLTDGVQAAVIIVSGADEGWSGTGRFTISRSLDWVVGGTWASPLFYTASTYDGIDANNVVIGTTNGFFTSYIALTADRTVPAPGAGAVLALAGLAAARRRR